MAQSNCDSLILHMIVELLAEEHNPQGKLGPPEGEHFISSSWYVDIIFVLQHLQEPLGMDKIRAIFLKQKEMRFCIPSKKLYWKEPRGVLLNCVEETKAKRLYEKLHVGECGRHHYYINIVNKIMRE